MKSDIEQFNHYALMDGGYEAVFNRNYPNAYTAFENLLQQAVHEGVDRPGVLDIGCGDGWTARQLGKLRSCRYLGLDPSDESILKARTRHLQDATFRTARAESILDTGERDRIFTTLGGMPDLVICNAALHQIRKDFPHIDQLIRNLADVCKPGGHLLIGDYFLPEDLSVKEREDIQTWVRKKTGQDPTPAEGFIHPNQVLAQGRKLGLDPAATQSTFANDEIKLSYYGTLFKKPR